MEQNQNYVELWGTVAQDCVFSHENHGQRFYKFPLRVERLSGQCDTLVIVVNESMTSLLCEGEPVRVTGQLRSFNNKSGQGSRLVITVFAQAIEPGDGTPFNRILLSGVLCKQPTLRRTPLGRSICDVILAVNRHYGRADYLPCILWGRTAQEISLCHTRDCIRICGRLQSRIYTKLTEEGPIERTTYEVSALQAELLCEQP